jgi:hypothetical protein
MKFCVRCGHQLNDNQKFCTSCGLSQPFVPPELLKSNSFAGGSPNAGFIQPKAETQFSAASTALVLSNVQEQQTADRLSALPLIIWSLILVAFFNPIGTPLTLIAAFFSINANAEPNPAIQKRNLRVSSMLCIIATVVDALSIIVLIKAALPFFY